MTKVSRTAISANQNRTLALSNIPPEAAIIFKGSLKWEMCSGHTEWPREYPQQFLAAFSMGQQLRLSSPGNKTTQTQNVNKRPADCSIGSPTKLPYDDPVPATLLSGLGPHSSQRGLVLCPAAHAPSATWLAPSTVPWTIAIHSPTAGALPEGARGTPRLGSQSQAASR